MNLISTLLFLGALDVATAFVVAPTTTTNAKIHEVPLTVCHSEFNTAGMWNRGLNFGKGTFKFYKNFNDWMSPFPAEDKAAFPEIFTLPKGTYEVDLAKPLGIIFEEIEVGKGLYVQDLVEGGNAEYSGKVKVGDNLVAITAIKVVGAKFERRLIPCRGFDFDTMVGAINSNDPKWGCDGVILLLERPDEADRAEVDKFLEFFEPVSAEGLICGHFGIII